MLHDKNLINGVCFVQYIWDGGQRGDVHRGDGVQHSGQLGGLDRRHCGHS